MKKLMAAMLLVVPIWVLGEEEAAAEPAEAAPAAAAESNEAKSGVTVEDAKLGTGVQDREIQGEADSFAADVGRVYCWSKIKGGEGTEVKHVWYKGDTKVSEVTLKIKFNSMRTWSYKTIPAGATGDCPQEPPVQGRPVADCGRFLDSAQRPDSVVHGCIVGFDHDRFLQAPVGAFIRGDSGRAGPPLGSRSGGPSQVSPVRRRSEARDGPESSFAD